MSVQEAPRVFVTYAHDSPAHKDQVRRFGTFLREQIGLDVHMDVWYDSVRRDWSAWAIEQLTEADFILVIASPEYRRRADGAAPPDEGRGSQFEAAILRNNLTRNLREQTERVLPVVLPGRSVDDVPTFLNAHSTTTFYIEDVTEEGVRDLLAAITGHGQYAMPERGQWLGGTAAVPAHRRVLLAGLPWRTHTSGLYPGSARIDGMDYDDSIVLRSRAATAAHLEVDLGGAYRRLRSVVGVLDDAREAFQVGHFRVCLDGSPRQEGVAALGKPATVDVDVAGALLLRLEMHRPGAPLMTLGLSGRLPELAWGNPTLC